MLGFLLSQTLLLLQKFWFRSWSLAEAPGLGRTAGTDSLGADLKPEVEKCTVRENHWVSFGCFLDLFIHPYSMYDVRYISSMIFQKTIRTQPPPRFPRWWASTKLRPVPRPRPGPFSLTENLRKRSTKIRNDGKDMQRWSKMIKQLKVDKVDYGFSGSNAPNMLGLSGGSAGFSEAFCRGFSDHCVWRLRRCWLGCHAAGGLDGPQDGGLRSWSASFLVGQGRLKKWAIRMLRILDSDIGWQ